jgi:acyl transferase domain-containing protein/NADPH:quinone reductase-like Zn-dependent oxidoreductase/acyl carrier protein
MTNNKDRSPVAVVGFSFRLPAAGGETLWNSLLAGKDLVSTVDADRWAQGALIHPNKNEPGTSYTFAAGSIGDVSGFDAAFFGISPREAEQMDPQQRVLLEMAWEAFEQAGIAPSSMRGSRCGVYVGLSTADYAYRRADDMGSIDSTTMTGGAGSIAANRISYIFDLHGPSMVIDTACSSSLVALHQACQSIRSGESDAALVGGISLHLHPYGFVGFSKASMLSREGRCKVFDADADGYVRSEGGGVVILKPLIQALADGNRILGIIAATGVNSDGRKAGLTVPSHQAQAALLREVYERAGISPVDIDYYEAHGTGTAVGDPLETRAIGEALGQRRPADDPLPIGSVKGNIGHLEAAAGMAGLVKVLHVLRERVVPPNINLQAVNPNIDLCALNLAPVVRPLTLAPDRRLVVGVSSFGFGGTNAHAVLTSFQAPIPLLPERVVTEVAESTPIPPLLLSARSPAALRAAAGDMARHLRSRGDLSLGDLVHSASRHRDVHLHRLAVSSADRDGLAAALDQFCETAAVAGVITAKHRPEATAPAFVYSGNGSQWAGMGLALLDESAAFAEAVSEVDALYSRLCGQSILAELRAPPDQNRFSLTEFAQPALFALQVGLTRMLEHGGVRPIAVCGHSVGEVAAAWASGALSLEQAIRVVHQRSAHQAGTRGQGCMTAVTLAADDCAALLAALRLDGRIVIAAMNAAHCVTVAGDADAMRSLEAALTQRHHGFQRLALDYAFHSPAMDPIEHGLMKSLRGLIINAPVIPLYSTVTGCVMDAAQGVAGLGADYWWRNVRQPVLFEAAIRAMLDAGLNTFVEIGPRAVLTNYITDIIKPRGAAAEALPSLTRHESGRARVCELRTQLELSGSVRDHASKCLAPAEPYVDLPHYPWQRERYWHPTSTQSLGLLTRHIVHPLLGYALKGEALHWENQLDVARLPVYADHSVGGGAVFPAAGFVEMALAAGSARRELEQRPLHGPQVIEDLEILAPLLLDSDRSCTVRLRMDAADGRFTIVSRERSEDDRWRTHATGRLVQDCVIATIPAMEMPARDPDIDAEAHYEFARSVGLHYGPAFRTVSAVWYRREGMLGALVTPAEIIAQAATAELHPAYLDGAFQLLADLGLRDQRAAPEAAAAQTGRSAFLPVRIARLELLQANAQVTSALLAVAGSRRRSRRSIRADFTLYDAAGAPVAIAQGVRFRAVVLQSAAVAPALWIQSRAVPMPRGDRSRAVALPTTAELARQCVARLHTPARLAARGRFSQEVEPLLDALCASFAAGALREHVGDQPVDAAALVASGRIAASSVPMLQSLLRVLTEDGVLQSIGGRLLWRADTTLPAHADIWSSLIADYPAYALLTARVGAAGLHLATRLEHGIDARAGKNPQAESATAWVAGCTQEEAADVAETVADVVRCAAAAQPVQSRLRVLRIVGAPPAEGLTLLPGLDPDRCDVVIGAANRVVLDDLRGRFPSVAALSCHVIDLDGQATPAAALGGGFDLIVLGEGIAGASEPLRRIVNMRELLLDGGRLVLLEQYTSRAVDLLFGLEHGWWEADSAEDAAMQSRFRAPEAWSELLTQAGFKMIEVVRDLPGTSSGPYLLIAAAGDGRHATPVAQPAPGTWLMVRDASGYSADLGFALTHELKAGGQRVVTVLAGATYQTNGPDCFALDPHSAKHWDRLLMDLKTTDSDLRGWIHLAGLDLSTAVAPLGVRADAQESRADVLVTWLKTCARHALRSDVWVVAAQAGTTLLPAAARPAVTSDKPADSLRDAALWGIARVAMQESADCHVRWIDLIEPLPCAANAKKMAQELLHPDAEDEILLTVAGRYVPRFAPTALEPAAVAEVSAGECHPRVQLDCSVPGPFRNLLWRAAPDAEALDDDEVEIDVHAAGLNFRDVMYAMGLLPDEAVEDGFCGPTLGMEVSGVVTRIGAAVLDIAPGDAVIAFAPASFSNRVRTRALAVTRKPADWSFAAAATVPTAFFTAYYALHELAHLRAGERVLIHGGAGGVGIAAIQLAKHLGAEIFVTVGTADKRDFVRLLGADHVFDSRSLAFADEVLKATGGEGVDVVLNSLAGDAISRNLRLLRPFGRMLELGKRDFYENTHIGLRPLRNNIAYFGIDADQLLAQRPDIARRVFVELMALFADRTLQPLPHRTFDASDIVSAFRHMQASRHIGKIVVTFPRSFAPLTVAAAQPSTISLRADATYVVSGGLSGFGLSTAAWLVRHGARHLALLSRRGAAATPEAAQQLARFVAEGVTLIAPPCDVADADALGDAFALIAATMPPIRGVIHAAMVIEDALIVDLDRGQLQRVLAPKIRGALNLHTATQARALDFFVLYSSATTLFGNPGQAAYVAANMSLEALASERRALGLPATCIGFGPIADVGYLARNERVLAALVGRMGGQALKSDDALQALGALVGSQAGNLAHLDLDWTTLGRSLPTAYSPKFSELARLAAVGEHGADAGESAQDVRRRLSELGAEDLQAELTTILRAEVAAILRIAPERIEPGVSLMDMGMDSLMAVELATSIESRLDVRLSALALSGGPTIESIIDRILRTLQPGEDSAAAHAGDAAIAAQVTQVIAQHAGELSAEHTAQVVDEVSVAPQGKRSLTRLARA